MVIDTSLLAYGVVGIIVSLIWVLISVFYTAVILGLLAKAFKLQKGFKVAFLTALVAGVINFLIRTVLQSTVGHAFDPRLLGSLADDVASSGILGKSALELALILLYWVLGFVVDSFAIKKFYKVQTGKAFLVGLLLALIATVVGFLVMLVGVVLVGIISAASA